MQQELNASNIRMGAALSEYNVESQQSTASIAQLWQLRDQATRLEVSERELRTEARIVALNMESQMHELRNENVVMRNLHASALEEARSAVAAGAPGGDPNNPHNVSGLLHDETAEAHANAT